MWTLTPGCCLAKGWALQESLIPLGSVPRSEQLGQRAGVPAREALAPCSTPPASLGAPTHTLRAGLLGPPPAMPLAASLGLAWSADTQNFPLCRGCRFHLCSLQVLPLVDVGC